MVTEYFGAFATGLIAHGLLSSISCLFPIIASVHLYLAIFSNVLIGLGASMILASTFRIMSQWTVKKEKGILCGIFGAGSFIGIMLTIPLSIESCLLKSSSSWQLAFYIPGGCNLLFMMFWIICVRSHPDTHPFMGKREEAYLKENRVESVHLGKIPWVSILRNKHCLGFFASHVFNDFSTYILIFFSTDLLRRRSSGYRSLREIGYPFITYWTAVIVWTPLFGIFFDFLQNRRYLYKLNCRRLFVGIGTLVPATMAIALASMSEEEITGSIIALLVWFSAIGANHGAGMYVSPIDMAPAFPDSFWSISNTLANCVAPLSVYLNSFLQEKDEGWKIMIFVCAGCYIVAFTIFCLFATVDEIKFSSQKDTGNPTVITKASVAEEKDFTI
ncbi:hypothetical protein ACOME3_008336 [Neoechinorhynchus agilis]